jgi:protein-tyrosine phosphatase
MHMISKQLLVGNIEAAREVHPAIGALLLVAEEYDVTPPSWVDYAKIPLKEFAAADPQQVREAVEWIERKIGSNRVLVCCRAGMGRSASIIIAYLCCVERLSYGEALKLVSARRPGALPLPFLEETIMLVKQLRAEQAVLAHEANSPDRPGGRPARKHKKIA